MPRSGDATLAVQFPPSSGVESFAESIILSANFPTLPSFCDNRACDGPATGPTPADKAEEGQARCWQQQAEESESREGATVTAAGAGTEGKSGEGVEESRGKICAAAGVAVVEQGRHGQY